MGNRPIPLRGHHLSRIGLFSLGERKYGELMVRTGYSEHSWDSFASKTYAFLRRLSENPDQRVLITAGEQDFICQICPGRKKTGCLDYKMNPLYGTAFWNSSLSPEGVDKKVAEESGLEIGGIYSVREITEATRKQAERFMNSLEVV